MIQNVGVAPIEAYTLLGASLSRDNETLIGQFGSGSKLAIATLLRRGLKVTIYCGLTRLDFKTKTIEVSDGVTSKLEKQIYVQFGGTSTRKQDLGWTLGMGELDWGTNHTMALREFVSNAIDRTIKSGVSVREAHTDCDLIVTVVPDDAVRAQKDHTRVFVEADEDVQKYADELPARFLHFTSQDLTQRILPKLGSSRKAQIYLEGVFVCELTNSSDSMCDYNFSKTQLKIDEARNLDEYSVRAAIGKLYRDAGVDDLVRLFTALSRGVECLETGLDSYYIKPNSWENNDQRRERWLAAWEKVNGEKTVACGHDQGIVGEYARRKGYDLAVIRQAAWLDTVKEYGIPTVGDVLDANEKKGRRLTAPTFEAIDAINQAWAWVASTDLMPLELVKPTVRGFDELMEAESDTLGFYDPKTREVYIRNDVGGELLLETALEEVGHYITGAADGSRDFATFFMRLFVRWMR